MSDNWYGNDMEFFRVFLKAPVFEKLICYTLNMRDAFRIDPDPLKYFIFGPEEVPVLEEGFYFVAQIQKEDLKDAELLEAAIELQKEALWSRLKLEEKLYLRRLFEDNSILIQLWRPVIVPNSL